MTSYFDDHDLSDDDAYPSAASATAPARLPSSARTLLSTFTSTPSANPSHNAATHPTGTPQPQRLDLTALPADSPLRNTLTMLDTLRASLPISHTDHQHLFLAGLIQELIGDIDGLGADSGPPPASKAFIATLPRATSQDLATAASAKGEAEIACSICTDTLSGEGDSDARKLPCGHMFDRECIVPWLELRNTCPVCRHEVPTDRKKPEEVRAEVRDRMGGLFGGVIDSDDEEDGQAGNGARRAGYSSYAGHVEDQDERDAFGMYS
ncbi:hypothetical protein BCR44DRAFT_59891 [Catenaria anguillulae PL171]|uniref:RING-type domain-containing protein n=1 Tax=Catenaria anguillulae PL171 TaxID=765915 RepID=A0A1Y2HN97_9FUNG|nr:hypothetical protein BCR44DRAFT_59891 [Catenaria anguillulae PL171]